MCIRDSFNAFFSIGLKNYDPDFGRLEENETLLKCLLVIDTHYFGMKARIWRWLKLKREPVVDLLQ